MTYDDQMRDLYRSIASASEEARIQLLHQALALATEAGDEDASYELNLGLVATAAAFGDTPTMLAAFDAAVALRTADPARFPDTITKPVGVELGYQAILLLEALGANAAIAREPIRHTLASLRHLYELSGTAELNMPRHALIAALRLGDVASWRTLAAELQERPRDTNSQCEACVQHDLVSVYRRIDGAEAGIAVAERMLREGLSCPIEPETTLAELLVPALLNGNSAFVTQHFARVDGIRLPYCEERLMLRTPLLALAALTENLALGLEMFESLLPDIGLVLHDDAARMEFFANAALLLDRATAHGLGERAVRDVVGVLPAQGLGDSSEKVATLAPKLWAAAEDVAARFDAGRGNTFRRDRVAEIRSWSSVSIPLSLGEPRAEPLAVELPHQPQDGAQWAARARDRSMLLDRPGAIDACDRALADAELDPALRSDMLAVRLRAHAEQAQIEAGVSSINGLDSQVRQDLADQFSALMTSLDSIGKSTRAAILTAMGLARYDNEYQYEPDQLFALLEQFAEASPDDRALLEAHLAAALGVAGDHAQAAEWAMRSAEDSQVDPDLGARQSARLFTTELLVRLGRPEAQSWLEQLIADCDDAPIIQAVSHMQLGQVHVAADELAAAAEHAQRASYLFASVDAPRQAADVAGTQASLLEHLGDLAGAAHVTRRILELSDPLEDYDQRPVRLDLGRLLVGADQAEQALTVLQELDSELGANPLVDRAVSYGCAYWLGRAYLSLGQPQEAANLWQAALNLAGSDDDPEQPVRLFTRALGDLLAEHGQLEASLEVFEAMREVAAASENPLVEVELNERVGLIRCLAGDPAGVDVLVRARTRAEDMGASWSAADITNSLARGLWTLGRLDEAVSTGLEASDRFGAVGDQVSSRGAFCWTASILANAERTAEAIALLEPVASDHEEFAQLLAALRDQDN